ncbi:MAG: hypothetical protein AAGA18_13635 [Verrucomicrobiota bacterium]
MGKQGGSPYLWKGSHGKLQGLLGGTYKLKLGATDNQGATTQATKNLIVKLKKTKKR